MDQVRWQDLSLARGRHAAEAVGLQSLIRQHGERVGVTPGWMLKCRSLKVCSVLLSLERKYRGVETAHLARTYSAVRHGCSTDLKPVDLGTLRERDKREHVLEKRGPPPA